MKVTRRLLLPALVFATQGYPHAQAAGGSQPTSVSADPKLSVAEEDELSANIWIAASAREGCGELTDLPERARQIARGFPRTEWRPDIYFGMERFDGEAEGNVEVRYQGRQLFFKELSAESCGDVVEALLLSLQIYVDVVRKADLALADEDPSDGIVEAAPPGWPGPDIDPFALPSDDDSAGRQRSKVEASVGLRPELLVGMVRGWNLLPNSIWGGTGAELSTVLPLNERVSLDGGARFLTSAPIISEGVRYHFSSTTFFLGPAHSWRVHEIATLRLNLTAILTFVHTATTVGSRRVGSPPYGSAGAGANVNFSINPWRALMFEARLGGQALSLNGVYLGRNNETVWEQPLLGTLGGIFIGWGGEKVGKTARKSPNEMNLDDFGEGLTLSEQ